MIPIAALALLATKPASVIPSLSDAQLCAGLARSTRAMVGYMVGPAKVVSAAPNCAAKRIDVRYAVTIDEALREKYVDTVLQAANSGLCVANDPTARAFRDRGWRWHYDFEFADRSVVRRDLTCH